MKAKAKRYNFEFWFCVFYFSVWSVNPAYGASTETLFGDGTQKKSQTRIAAVYFSDGKVLTGEISLTPGRSFKLNIPKAGKLKTRDMVTGEDVQYGKVRYFTFEPIREIRFYPEKEEMRRSWKFIETTKYNEKTGEADYSPAAKEYSGRPYPLRYLAATVIFNSDESLQGHLYTVTVYLKTGKKTHRLVLRSKQRGGEGTTLDELVYVQRIKLLDEGKNIAAKVTVKFADMRFGPKDAVQAVTKESLTPIPTKMTESDDTCVVESAFGEEFYLAVRKDGKYIVGWPPPATSGGRPEEQNKQLFALARDHIQRQRDFYNEKKLLGVLAPTSDQRGQASEDGKEVLTLVSLRRKVAPTHFGEIGGEWDRELGTVVEPWRLSIWRWKYDKANQELILSARGTFFRVILLPEDSTPEVIISEKLWSCTNCTFGNAVNLPVESTQPLNSIGAGQRKDDTVIVGQSPKKGP